MAGTPDFTPPQELFPHRLNYAEVAQNLFELVKDLCDITPDDRVLDVGCGAGRLAGPLTGFLGPEGSYEGFDSSKERIDWCNEHIAPHHPRFRFTVADVYSGQYNPAAAPRRASTSFPYGDGEFDVVLLSSVFTHMLPDDVAHYLDEIGRVMKPGGRSMITWFLLNDEVERLARGAEGPPPRPRIERARRAPVTRLRGLSHHEPAGARARDRLLRALGAGGICPQRPRDRGAGALRRVGGADADRSQPGRGRWRSAGLAPSSPPPAPASRAPCASADDQVDPPPRLRRVSTSRAIEAQLAPGEPGHRQVTSRLRASASALHHDRDLVPQRQHTPSTPASSVPPPTYYPLFCPRDHALRPGPLEQPSTSSGISRAMRERGTTRSNPASSARRARVDVDVRVEAEPRHRRRGARRSRPAASRSTITQRRRRAAAGDAA